jgi:hypothetical protein
LSFFQELLTSHEKQVAATLAKEDPEAKDPYAVATKLEADIVESSGTDVTIPL